MALNNNRTCCEFEILFFGRVGDWIFLMCIRRREVGDFEWGHVCFGLLLSLDIIRIKSIFDNASENSNTIEIYTHANNKNQTV